MGSRTAAKPAQSLKTYAQKARAEFRWVVGGEYHPSVIDDPFHLFPSGREELSLNDFAHARLSFRGPWTTRIYPPQLRPYKCLQDGTLGEPKGDRLPIPLQHVHPMSLASRSRKGE